MAWIFSGRVEHDWVGHYYFRGRKKWMTLLWAGVNFLLSVFPCPSSPLSISDCGDSMVSSPGLPTKAKQESWNPLILLNSIKIIKYIMKGVLCLLHCHFLSSILSIKFLNVLCWILLSCLSHILFIERTTVKPCSLALGTLGKHASLWRQPFLLWSFISKNNLGKTSGRDCRCQVWSGSSTSNKVMTFSLRDFFFFPIAQRRSDAGSISWMLAGTGLES